MRLTLPLVEFEDISDLALDLSSSLELVHIDEEEVYPVVSIGQYDQYYERYPYQPGYQGSLE